MSNSHVSHGIPPIIGHDPNSVTNFPITAISAVAMMVISIFLMSYYIFVIKFCLWSNADLVRVHLFSTSRRYEEYAAENRGLEEAVIQSIPVIQYKKQKTDYGEKTFSECAVCLNEFQENDKLRVIPSCSHVFHIDCIDVWLRNNANCPLCRTRVSLTNQVYVDQLLTPRSSLQDQSQSVENFIGGVEDFVVIDLDNDHEIDQNLQARQVKGEELEVQSGSISPSKMKKARKLHKVTSFRDDCIGMRNKDGGFSVQPIRRSFSMDLSVHRDPCSC